MKFEYVRALVAAHYERDGERFETTVRQIMASGPKSARSLARYLNRPAMREVTMTHLQQNHWMQVAPQRLDDVVLQAPTLAHLRWVVEQRQRADELRDVGQQPASRLLMHGKPGTGKTMSAAAIGDALGLPVMLLRTDAAIEPYMGNTAKNFRDALAAAEQIDAVFLLDEIDSVGGVRRNETGAAQEMARVTNTMLSLLDATSDHALLIATTNRIDLLDPALLRRWTPIRFAPARAEQLALAERRGILWTACETPPAFRSMAEVAAACDEAARISTLRGLSLEEAAAMAASSRAPAPRDADDNPAAKQPSSQNTEPDA